jgi:hypothetical protein
VPVSGPQPSAAEASVGSRYDHDNMNNVSITGLFNFTSLIPKSFISFSHAAPI